VVPVLMSTREALKCRGMLGVENDAGRLPDAAVEAVEAVEWLKHQPDALVLDDAEDVNASMKR